MTWNKCTIGDLCDSVSITYRGNAKKVVLINTSDVFDGKILNHDFVANEGLKGQFKKTFAENDILYSEIRPANRRFAFVDFCGTKNYIASTKLMVIRPRTDKVRPRFLYAILTAQTVIDELQHLAETRSGTFPQITFDGEVAPIPVRLPSFEAQDAIVSIIDSIDGKIDENRKINHNLQQQADAIFAREFLELPAIPPGWTQGSLLDIANYQNGLAMQKYRPKTTERGIPVLKIKELRQGICDDASELCSESISPTYIVQDGDVIFSWSGTLLVDFWCGGVCGLNQHLFKVTSDRYEKWFYYAWTRHHLQSFIAYASAMATTMGHIKRGELEKAEVLIPSPNDLSRIGSCLMPIYDAIISNRIENHRLIEIRDSLLPKLMSGEIDVSKTKI